MYLSIWPTFQILRDISPGGGGLVDTPPSSPLALVKEVSSIQVAVTYTDGSTEIRGFGSKSQSLGSTPLSPAPSSEEDPADQEPMETTPELDMVVFEPQEIKTFPQASGYMNADNIWTVTKNTDRETLLDSLPLPVQDEPLCLKVNTAITESHLVKCNDGAVIPAAKLTSADDKNACRNLLLPSQDNNQVVLMPATALQTYKKFAPIAPRPPVAPSLSDPDPPSSCPNLQMTSLPTAAPCCKPVDKRERSFACTYDNCGKTYLKSSHLKAHVRVHTGTVESCHNVWKITQNVAFIKS